MSEDLDAGTANLSVESHALPVRVTLVTVDLLLMLAILMGNILTIAAVRRSPQLQTVTNKFVVSLAVADLLVGFSLPYHSLFYIIPSISTMKYACLARFCIVLLACMASFLNLLAICVDRFLAVVYPLHYPMRMTPRSSSVKIIILWIMAVSSATIPLGWNHWDSAQYCVFYHVLPPMYVVFILAVPFYSQSLLMLLLYGKIFKEARRQLKKMAALSPDARRVKKEAKTAKTLATVLGFFILFGFPLITFMFIMALGYSASHTSTVYAILTSLTFFNSALNPVVYAWKNRQFNSTFRRMLGLHQKTFPVSQEISTTTTS